MLTHDLDGLQDLVRCLTEFSRVSSLTRPKNLGNCRIRVILPPVAGHQFISLAGKLRCSSMILGSNDSRQAEKYACLPEPVRVLLPADSEGLPVHGFRLVPFSLVLEHDGAVTHG